MPVLTLELAMEICIICKQPLGTSPASILGEKGSTTINQASEARNDTIHSVPQQQVHQECRRKYCNPDQIAKAAKLAKQGHGAVIDTGRHVQSIKGARSYFEERSLERAPFENTGAEAGARSFVQMSIIQIIESIHEWDCQNSFALSGVRINRSEIN